MSVEKKPLRFIVAIEQPKDASVRDVREYIAEAVALWYGRFTMEHPLWGIGRWVKVARYTKPRCDIKLLEALEDLEQHMDDPAEWREPARQRARSLIDQLRNRTHPKES